MAPESAHFYRGLGCRLNVPDIWGLESPMKWPFSVNRFAWTFEGSVAPPVINETGEDGMALNINFVVPSKKPEPIEHHTIGTGSIRRSARRSQSQGITVATAARAHPVRRAL